MAPRGRRNRWSRQREKGTPADEPASRRLRNLATDPPSSGSICRLKRRFVRAQRPTTGDPFHSGTSEPAPVHGRSFRLRWRGGRDLSWCCSSRRRLPRKAAVKRPTCRIEQELALRSAAVPSAAKFSGEQWPEFQYRIAARSRMRRLAHAPRADPRRRDSRAEADIEPNGVPDDRRASWWRANEIVMRHLTRQTEARYVRVTRPGQAIEPFPSPSDPPARRPPLVAPNPQRSSRSCCPFASSSHQCQPPEPEWLRHAEPDGV